jgi:hypothetical protein
MLEMGRNARARYEAKYTAEHNYKMLMEVYQQAIEEARRPLTSYDRNLLPAPD